MTRPGKKIIQAKLVLLGDMGTGKTSLVLRFVKGQFFDSQEPTVGAAFFTQILSLTEATVKFDICDTAGQERYHSLAPMYYRGASAAIIAYDITCKMNIASIDLIYDVSGLISSDELMFCCRILSGEPKNGFKNCKNKVVLKQRQPTRLKTNTFLSKKQYTELKSKEIENSQAGYHHQSETSQARELPASVEHKTAKP